VVAEADVYGGLSDGCSEKNSRQEDVSEHDDRGRKIQHNI
jgi:hypothetical protein